MAAGGAEQLGRACWATTTSQGLNVIYRQVDEERLALFERLSKLGLPGLPRLHFVGFDSDNTPCIVEQRVEGVSLRDLMARSVIRDARDLAGLIARSVHDLHTQGQSAHCDLKPEHVMFIRVEGGDLEAVLLDLEFAVDLTSTQAPAVNGFTPLYVTSEQLAGKACSEATDIRALGIMLLELCQGAHPFAEAVCHLAPEEIAVEVAGMRFSPESRDPLITLGAYMADPDPRLRPGWDVIWDVLPYPPRRTR